jgi:hypothetical protein
MHERQFIMRDFVSPSCRYIQNININVHGRFRQEAKVLVRYTGEESEGSLVDIVSLNRLERLYERVGQGKRFVSSGFGIHPTCH